MYNENLTTLAAKILATIEKKRTTSLDSTSVQDAAYIAGMADALTNPSLLAAQGLIPERQKISAGKGGNPQK